MLALRLNLFAKPRWSKLMSSNKNTDQLSVSFFRCFLDTAMIIGWGETPHKYKNAKAKQVEREIINNTMMQKERKRKL